MDILAVDIGGTHFSVAGFRDSQLLASERMATDRQAGPDWLVQQIRGACSRLPVDFQPSRCGVGFGGPVNFDDQALILSTHVAGWDGYPLVDKLREFLAIPIIMDNDANVGALGEYRFGAGRSRDPLFYMTLSTGIGGGIVLGGQLCRGADSFAGELGHMNIEPEGPPCLCGSNGCFERMCCGLWLERDYQRSAKDLLSDPAFVSRYVVRLARGLKAVLMMLNPERIVIGGGLSKAGDRLFIPLRAEVARQLTSWSKARRDIVPAELGDHSVLYGAVALAETYL